jgi:predicted MPP superfamily phosphohydrolase
MRLLRHLPRLLQVLAILAVLLVVPWWTLVGATTSWPGPAAVIGAAAFALAFVGLPTLMILGHGPAQSDPAARVGDALLGVIWVLFSWSVIGNLAGLVLLAAGMPWPAQARVVALAVLVVVLALLGYGLVEAWRVPRVRTLEVTLPRLGVGLDGLRLVMISDTHFGPLDRAGWSAKVVDVVNALRPDLVCHVGDLADGAVARRRDQVAPLARVRAELGRFYVTGNHEYFGDPVGWIEHMTTLGWQPLHNAHRVVCRGGDQLVVAGVDDPTGVVRLTGHGPDLAAALTGTNHELPVLLLAHQPVLVEQAARVGVALQLSGHTHGGQIWPFHYLVRLEQPVRAGLSRHAPDTQLYTSRGTGFWGPPLRIFAPSEITVLVLRAAGSRPVG